MKKIVYLLLFILTAAAVNSQVVTEKSILKVESLDVVDAYTFSYDEKSGTYLYMKYDSTKTPTNMIYSNKGNSGYYEYIDYYSTVYDNDGNYFVTANNRVNDTTYTYYLLRNGKQEMQCEFINNEIALRNGLVYFLCRNNGKYFTGTYDIATGQISKGREYDEIQLCHYDKIPYEGEPIPKFGFTKAGKPFYVAKNNGKAFMVIGEEEQKQFADIETYNFVTDKNGIPAYSAKDTGSFMNTGGAFIVYGNKQFRPFSYVYNLIFDEKGNIYYVGTEESADYMPQTVMRNDKPISKTYSGGVYNLGFTPDNKLYYIASEKKKNSEEYESFVVLDGKEGKKFQSVLNLKVMPNNTLLYTATKNEDVSVIVYGDEEIIVNKRSVLNSEILENGSFAYTSVIFGNYEKKIKDKYFLNIDGKEFGPYEGMQSVNYETGNYLYSDKDGNYAFIINKSNSQDIYSSAVIWKGGKSNDYDYIQDISLYKGKPIYTAARTAGTDTYISLLRVFYGSKAVTKEYDGISNYKFDEKKGIATFLVTKGNELFKVEIKF